MLVPAWIEDWAENLGYTQFDTSSPVVRFKKKYGSGAGSFSTSWGNTEEYEDGSVSHNSTAFSLNQNTVSPLVDLYLTPISEIQLTFTAVSPGNTITSSQVHTITIESEEDIKIRTYGDLRNFFSTLGFQTHTGSFHATPTILCDEVDSETNTTTTTEVVFEDGFETSTVTHIIDRGAAAGGDTLPAVAEQVEENEGDIFVLNNEVDELAAGIYQLRRDNQDQDAYWEEVYVRVRDFSGRVRDEVQDLRDHVDAQPAFWDTTINAINRNVRAAQDAAANAENAVFGLTGQLQALQARIEALENQ